MNNNQNKNHTFIIFTIIAFAVVLIPLIIFLTFKMSAEKALEKKLCEFRKKGYPTTLDELNDYYTYVPDDENAALLYEQVEIKITKPDDEDKIIFRGFNDYLETDSQISQDVIDASSAYLAENQPVLDILEKASKLNKSRYTVDFTDGAAMTLPELGKINNYSKLLSLKTFFDIKNKDYLAIDKNLYQQVKLIKSLEKFPCLISYLVNIAGTDTFIKSHIRMIITEDGFKSLGQLKTTQGYIENLFNKDGFKDGFIGEMNMFTWVKNILWSDSDFTSMQNKLYWYKFFAFNDFVLCAKFYGRFIDLATQERSLTVIKNAEKVRNEIDDIYKNSYKYNYMLFKMLMPSLGGIFQKDLEHSIKIKLAITALELEKYYLKYQKYPDDINEIISKDFPELLIDSYSEKPFKYLKLSDISYKLYSVGMDLTDNDGFPINLKGSYNNKDEDIVFFIDKNNAHNKTK